jgi:hypothetical protein
VREDWIKLERERERGLLLGVESGQLFMKVSTFM